MRWGRTGRIRPRLISGLALAASCLLAACASDGSQRANLAPLAAAPAFAQAPPALSTAPATPTPPPAPNPSSAEFKANYGLTMINAASAYAAGATGKGVTVAVIDSGVNSAYADLAPNLSPQSIDIDSRRNNLGGGVAHGTDVAGVVGASLNGQGTVGVAYQASILAIRADNNCANPIATTPPCLYVPKQLADAINYAVSRGARVINLSIAQDKLSGPALEQAFANAARRGVVMVVAAGNAGDFRPRQPAQYAIEFPASVVAVGAVGSTQTLASFSNRAGGYAKEYMVAPGVDIVTGCIAGACDSDSGTSFAAPHISGALALLLQAFPNLTGPQALAILEKTADDLGAPGVDLVYGFGLLDLKKAFQPVGGLKVPVAGMRTADAAALVGSSLSASFGDAVARGHALTTVGFDGYQRQFTVDLAGGFPLQGRGLLPDLSRPTAINMQSSLDLGPGARLEFAAATPRPLPEPLRQTPLALPFQQAADLHLQLRAGRLQLAVSRGQAGALQTFGPGGQGTAFSAVVRASVAASAGYDFGGFTLTGEAGQGAPLMPYAAVPTRPSTYAQVTLGRRARDVEFALTVGALSEPEGPLGSLLPLDTSFGLPARTRFAIARAQTWLTPRIGLAVQAGLGETRAAGPLVSLATPALTSTWRLTAWTERRLPGVGPTQFTLDLEQPLRVEQGAFAAIALPTVAAGGEELSFQTRRFSAVPSGRELDLRLGASRQTARLGAVDLQLIATRDLANVAGQPVALGLLAGWRTAF